jgi:hypothetical protein
MSASCLDPPELIHFPWLMVLTQVKRHCSIVFGSNCPTVTNINNIQIIIKSHNKIGTTSRFTVLHFLCHLEFLIHLVDISLVSQFGSFLNCTLHVFREIRLKNDIVVQMFFQILSALVASMPIVDRKDLNLWPEVIGHLWFLLLGLDYIQNNCDPVFIHFSHKTNMCISGK